jgi:hypothetical protein
MPRRLRSIALGIALVALSAVSLLAQSAKWAQPYDKAIDAIKKQQWQQAIPLLEQAIAADPTPDANKRVESVVTVPYFPQYYLFVAHLKLNQLDKARTYYGQRGALPAKLSAEATTHFKELTDADQRVRTLADFEPLVKAGDTAYAARQWAEAAKNYEQAKQKVADEFQKRGLQAKLDDATGKVAAERTQAQNLAAFEAAVKRAETQFAAKQYPESIASYGEARTKLPDEFRKRGLDAKETDAKNTLERIQGDLKKGEAARSHVTDGQKLLASGRLIEAKAQFQQAQAQVSGIKEAADGLAEINKHEADYGQAKARAEQLYKNGKLPDARDEFARAQKAHPQYFERDKLGEPMAAITRAIGLVGVIASAKKAFTEKRWPEAVAAASSALQSDPANREMAQLRNQAEARVAFDAGKGLAGRNNKEAAVKFAEAKAKDPGFKDASDELVKVQKLLADAAKVEAAKADVARAEAVKVEAARAEAARIEAARVEAARVEAARVEAARLEAVRQAAALKNAEALKLAEAAKNAETAAASAARAADDLARAGLLALFKGEAGAALEPLNQAIAGSGKAAATRRATLYAYLGVAYATISLQAAEPNAQSENKDKALQEFRRAIKEQRNYTFPQNLVSPRVRDMFEEAKKTAPNP